jgi:hypothetical protein
VQGWLADEAKEDFAAAVEAGVHSDKGREQRHNKRARMGHASTSGASIPSEVDAQARRTSLGHRPPIGPPGKGVTR